MKLQTLWKIDPGYYRLKHAAKTILAILITLWLVRNEAVPFKLLVGIISGFSMQGVVAKSFFSRIAQIIVLDIAYFLAFIVGLVVNKSNLWTAFVLVVVGFFANYLRRFGLQQSLAPMMGWSICFFATILPFSNTDSIWTHTYGLSIALLVSAVVNGFVFPENYPRLFVDNSNRLFKTLAQGMREMRRYVHGMHSSIDTVNRTGFIQLTETLNQLLVINQAIQDSDVFVEQHNKIDDILIQQYALVHTYMMSIDAFRILSKHDSQLSPAARLGLSLMYKRFEKLFNSMIMMSDFTVISPAGTIPLVNKLKQTALEPAIIIVLLNLKLSFNLFNRHVAQLLRRPDAN